MFKRLISYLKKINLRFDVIFKYFLNIDFSYKKKKIDILVLDEKTKKNFFYLKKDFSIEFIPTRGERVNFFILLKTFWFFLFSKISFFECYILAYIDYTKSQILISAVENKKFFNIKNIRKNIKTVFFQYDFKSKENLKFLNSIKADIDLIFCTGPYWANYLKKFSRKKPEFLPSLYNHKVKDLKKNDTKKLYYISTYRHPSSYKSENNFFHNFHYKKDFFLLKILNEISIKRNIKVNIILTYKKDNNYPSKLIIEEKRYFKKMLPNKNINFVDSNIKRILNNNNSLFVNLDSALGFQLAAIGKKCVFFPIRKRKNQQVQFNDMPNFGKFWSKKMNFIKVKNIILNNYDNNLNHNLIMQKYINNFFIINPKISFKEVNKKISDLLT